MRGNQTIGIGDEHIGFNSLVLNRIIKDTC